MATCLPKSVHFQEAEGHTIGLPFTWLLLLEQAKEVARALTQCQLRSQGNFSVRNTFTPSKIETDSKNLAPA